MLDHRTPLGKAIVVSLLATIVDSVGVYVLRTYALGPDVGVLLWDVEVALALVFGAEYVLRLYGAPDRVTEFLNGFTVADLLSILPTFAVLLFPGLLAAGTSLGFLRALRVVRFLPITGSPGTRNSSSAPSRTRRSG